MAGLKEDVSCSNTEATPQDYLLKKASMTRERKTRHLLYKHQYIWCAFDLASSLICGNKMPTRCNRWFLLQILLLVQHVSGTIMPIIRSSRVLYKWLLPVVFGALVFKLSVWCGAEGCVSGLRAAAKAGTGSNLLYNTLELLMMGIMVPETCWASNKICNKNHLLHLVGIFFPHKHQYVLNSHVILRVAISANTSRIEIKLTINKMTYLLRQHVTGYMQHTCKQEEQFSFTR